MQKTANMKIVLLAAILLAAGAATLVPSSASAGSGRGMPGQPPVDPWDMVLFGGPGDQYGNAVVVQGAQVIAAGHFYSGWLRSYSIPMSPAPLWALVESGHQPISLASNATALYALGAAIPPTCGAYDSSGGTEPKVMFAKYSLTGTPIGCGSYNFFPYRGYEYYYAAAASNEGGMDYVYAAGNAEQAGWAYSGPFVLAKYDPSGVIVNAVTEPGIALGTGFTYPRKGMSNVRGLTIMNGHLYAVGESWLPYLLEDAGSWDWGQRPVLMKYDFGLNRIWKYRADIAPSYPGYSGRFMSVTSAGGFIYAAGQAIPGGVTGNFDFLVEKFDESGNRIWSASWGDLYEDRLNGIVAVGNRLFAVGYSYETAHTSTKDGDADVVIFEIDQANGCWQLIDRIGGDGVDWATGVATDGHDLYIVGNSTSFASADGNSIGDLEIMLIHYPLNRTPVADDLTVAANAGLPVDIILTASDEDDDALTYEVVSGPSHGILSGTAPDLTYTAQAAYYGPDSLTFKANDGTEDSNIATVTIAVNHVPVVDNQSVSTDENVARAITLGPAVDVDGDPLSYIVLSGPLHGTMSIVDNVATYTPLDYFYGSDALTFQANDTKTNSNVATVSITVRRIFAFTGFESPIDNQPTVNSAKAGSTIPVKWRITDLDGSPISDPSSFISLISNNISCQSLTGDAVDEVEIYAGASGLQYIGDGLWQYNWKTPKSYARQCRVMVLKLGDGSAHSAYFSFK